MVTTSSNGQRLAWIVVVAAVGLLVTLGGMAIDNAKGVAVHDAAIERIDATLLRIEDKLDSLLEARPWIQKH